MRKNETNALILRCIVLLLFYAMATFKTIILPHHKREDGTYNVKIRVTHNRKTKYLKTPYYIGGNDVARRKRNGKDELKIKNQAVIDAVDRLILDYRNRLLPVALAVESWDIDRLTDFLKNDITSFSLDFIDYGYKYADALMAKGKESTGLLYHNAIKSLIRFIGKNTLDVKDITSTFLLGLEMYLRKEPVIMVTHGKRKITKKKKKERSILICMQHIKVMYEAAKYEYNDEENCIIRIPYSPFSRYKMPKVQSTEHRVLTIEQMQSIIDYPYTGKNMMQDLAKDVFILSFSLMGINTADLYEGCSLDGDILVYRRKKTRDRREDKAEIKVRIEPEIKKLFAKYKGNDGLFCFMDRYKDAKAFNRAVNAGLDKIGASIGVPNLTFYYARHTMASICANVLNVDIARVDEMLNHSDSKLKMARVYIQKDFKPLWDANRRLLDLFDWSYIKKAEG